MTHSSPNEKGAASPAGHGLKSARTTYSFTSSRLGLNSNPLQKSEKHSEGGNLMTTHEGHGEPVVVEDGKEPPVQFRKREAASTVELFYDLWFVANLTVFANAHPISNRDNLVSFMCYFLLLWITWFVTTVFEARYGQDSILGRMSIAGHLGVMMGFAIVGVSFDQTKLIRPIFKTMALCLMASRLILTVQYSLVLFHARQSHRAKKPLIFAIAVHLIAGIIYLISSRFPDKSNVSIVWYVVGAVELIVLLVHATLSATLSFKGTHFTERLNLLTLIIIGEGVIILSKNLNSITNYTWVKDNSYQWSASLCGQIACVAAMIYLAYQLYFDWMDHHLHVNSARQALWAVCHLPLHLALVLLAEGSGQCVLWWHATESVTEATTQLLLALLDTAPKGSSIEVAKALNSTAQSVLTMYGSTKGGDLNDTLTTVMELPSSLWASLMAGNLTETDEGYEELSISLDTIFIAMFNAISDAFKLSVKTDKKSSKSSGDITANSVNSAIATSDRLELIFIYVFISAGVVLILLMGMHLVSKHRKWSGFNIVRTSAVFAVGVGLSLLSLLATNDTAASNYLSSAWLLPTVTLAYAFVLVLTHLRYPNRFFGGRGSDDMETGYTPRESQVMSSGGSSTNKPYDPVAVGDSSSDANTYTGYNGGHYATQTTVH